MCQLCAPHRAVEPHPPLHLWDGGVPAHLHVHQQGLESRGEQGGREGKRKRKPLTQLPEWDLPHNSLSCRPGKRRPAKYFRSTNWDTDLFMNSPRTLPCDILTIYFLQDYLFRLVPGYVDSGKGKCSYDPKQENIAVLIRKSRQRGNKITNSFKIPHATESRSLTSALTSSLSPPPLQMVTCTQVSTLTS